MTYRLMLWTGLVGGGALALAVMAAIADGLDRLAARQAARRRGPTMRPRLPVDERWRAVPVRRVARPTLYDQDTDR